MSLLVFNDKEYKKIQNVGQKSQKVESTIGF